MAAKEARLSFGVVPTTAASCAIRVRHGHHSADPSNFAFAHCKPFRCNNTALRQVATYYGLIFWPGGFAMAYTHTWAFTLSDPH